MKPNRSKLLLSIHKVHCLKYIVYTVIKTKNLVKINRFIVFLQKQEYFQSGGKKWVE